MPSLPQHMIIIFSEGGRSPGSKSKHDLHVACHKAQTVAGSRSTILLWFLIGCLLFKLWPQKPFAIL